MNFVEKILARASGRESVEPGEIVVANVDRMVLHDLSANFVARVFDELPRATIKNPERVAIVFDHTFSPPTGASAERLATVRRFAKRHRLENLFDCGSGSLHHVVLENGLWSPGEVIVGCDSHTTIYGALGAFATGIGNDSMAALGLMESKAWFRVPERVLVRLSGTVGPGVGARDVAQYLVGKIGEDGAVYQAVEYAGPFIENLSVDDRLLFPLMAIDLGAKAGYINPDERSLEYARSQSISVADVVRNDDDVSAESAHEIDVSTIEPQVACPPTVGNVVPVGEVEGTPIQIAEVGGSTGGRLVDLETTASILEGRHVHPEVRLQIVPATAGIYCQALAKGYIAALSAAGAIVFPPGAGSNQAVNMGAMASGEAMLSTQARNFPGRNGSPDAKHYLASAETVAASALAGTISDPRHRASTR